MENLTEFGNKNNEVLELSKQNMIYDIVTLIRDDVIGFDDLEGFSEDLKEKVSFILLNIFCVK